VLAPNGVFRYILNPVTVIKGGGPKVVTRPNPCIADYNGCIYDQLCMAVVWSILLLGYVSTGCACHKAGDTWCSSDLQAVTGVQARLGSSSSNDIHSAACGWLDTGGEGLQCARLSPAVATECLLESVQHDSV
jgi:hypothetical protein